MSINKIIRHTFIVAFLGVSSLSGIAAEKNIRIKVSDEVYLNYRGTAEKKTPLGNGMISVIKDEHVIDKISGVFNGQSVTNATVNFIEGTVFKGDIEYKTSDADIIYVVSNGSFEVKMNGYKQPEIIPISGPVEIRRIWKDIRFVGMYLQSNSSLSSNKVILYKKTEILNKPLLGLYDRFVGTKPTITKEWTASFHPSGHVNNIEPRDDKNICYRFDYGDKGQGIYIIQDSFNKSFSLHCSNGDSLSHLEASSHRYMTVLRHIDGGEMAVHLIDGYNFNIEDPHYNENLNTRQSSIKHEMPLVEKFYQGIPEQYKSWIGCLWNLWINDREGQDAKNTGSDLTRCQSEIAVEATYADGSSYFGTIYMPVDKNKKDDVMYIGNLPNKDVDFYSGLYTTSQGEKKYFLYGYPADEFVQIANRKSEEIRAEKERTEMENRQQQEAREKEAKAYREELSRKYGKKYVDAIYDQYSILVGTPEGLLKEYYFLTVRRETKEHIVYSVARAYRANFMVWVNKSTHKVDEVRDL